MTNKTAITLSSTANIAKTLGVIMSNRAPATRRKYTTAISQYLTWCSEMTLPTLDRLSVQAYVAKRTGEGMSPSTVNTDLAAIRSLVTELQYHTDDLTEKDVVAITSVKGVKKNGSHTGLWMTPAQAKKALGIAETSILNVQEKVALSMMLVLGMRNSEVLNAQWSNIKVVGGEAFIDISNKGRERSVVMPRNMIALLYKWNKMSGGKGCIVKGVNKHGGVTSHGLCADSLAKKVKKHCGRQFTPHDLRRTYARTLHNNGHALETVASMLGHGSVEQTRKYIGATVDFNNLPTVEY